MSSQRQYTLLDKLCMGVDQALKTLTNQAQTSGVPYPGHAEEPTLNETERKHSAGLMRVNHAGEVCAQALYHGQAIASRASSMQAQMERAALEEGDHLSWCKQRLDELNSHTSYLNPLWYAGSFCIGLAAGVIGDQWSLGFVAETEKQVIKHLTGHMAILPTQDIRSHQILSRMENDEARHRDEALQAGAHDLPTPVKLVMGWTSKIMVNTAYYV